MTESKTSVPLDEEGYHQSFKIGVDSNQDILDFFKRYGFVILRDIVPSPMIDAVIEDIWENYINALFFYYQGDKRIEKQKPRIERNDPATWKLANWLRIHGTKYNEKRGFLGNNFSLSQVCWNIRQHPDLYQAFAIVLEDHRLNVKLDRYGLMRPTKIWSTTPSGTRELVDFHPEWKTEERWIHWDQNPWKEPGFVRVQGVLTLSEQTEISGGFHCIPGFTHEFAEWGPRNIELQNDASLVDMPKNDPAMERILRPRMRKGSLLIWDSRTPHGNYPNEGPEFRMAMYVTMFKEADRDSNQPLAQRFIQEVLEENNVELTDLGRKLTTLLPWD
jgi:hypothetical protein